MHSPTPSDLCRTSLTEKKIIKEVKRDLIRFMPSMVRRTRRATRDFESKVGTCLFEYGKTLERRQSDEFNSSQPKNMRNSSKEYSKILDHQNPTFSSSKKHPEVHHKSISYLCPRVNSSHSIEPTTRNKIHVNREEKVYDPKKLVYPFVKKLKSCISISNRKKILYDHINRNMKHKNLKVSQEFEVPSVSKLTNNTHFTTLPMIPKLGKDYKMIKVNHKKTGIMRRNKLLLEHIMHERIRSKEIYRTGLGHYKS